LSIGPGPTIKKQVTVGAPFTSVGVNVSPSAGTSGYGSNGQVNVNAPYASTSVAY
jgi:hypothetical protein